MKYLSDLYYTYDIDEYFKLYPKLTRPNNTISVLRHEEIDLICCSQSYSSFNYYVKDKNAINFIYTGKNHEWFEFYYNQHWLLTHIIDINNYPVDEKEVKFILQARKIQWIMLFTYALSKPTEISAVFMHTIIKKTFLVMKLQKLVFY